MGGVYPLVVGEHEHLVVPHDGQQVREGEDRPIPGRCRGLVGDIGGHIDTDGNDNEKDYRQRNGSGHVGAEPGQGGGEIRRVLLGGGQLPPFPALEDQPQQPQQGQPHPGVHHRPLAGAADAPEQPAQEQGGDGLAQPGAGGHRQPPVHEVVGH